MKTRYKFLIVIFLLWLGMTYEGARNESLRRTENTTARSLAEQIAAYEAGFGLDAMSTVTTATTTSPPAVPMNVVSHMSRNIGDAIQTAVRETLRSIVRFFDNVIS